MGPLGWELKGDKGIRDTNKKHTEKVPVLVVTSLLNSTFSLRSDLVVVVIVVVSSTAEP